MRKRKALGKGLSSLIPVAPPVAARSVVLELDVGLIRPNPRQPRRSFDDASLAELGQSIKVHGLLQPVVVRREGETFELIVGERRWRAAVMVGIHQIPAVVRDIKESQRLEAALVENLQREDLNPMEDARACRVLIEDLGITHDDLARRLGRSRPNLSNILRILTLDENIQSRIEGGELTLGHAKAIVGLAGAADQRRLADEVVRQGLSVRQTEQRVARLLGAPAREEKANIQKTKGLMADPNVRDAEDRLQKALGTPVRIRGRARAGRIEIDFRGMEELQRLFEVLERAAHAAAPPALIRTVSPPRDRSQPPGGAL